MTTKTASTEEHGAATALASRVLDAAKGNIPEAIRELTHQVRRGRDVECALSAIDILAWKVSHKAERDKQQMICVASAIKSFPDAAAAVRAAIAKERARA